MILHGKELLDSPGQDDYIDFNMEQNDRGEWRLTIEQTTEIKTPNGVLFDEKERYFLLNFKIVSYLNILFHNNILLLIIYLYVYYIKYLHLYNN